MITGGADENTLFTVEGLNKDKYDVDLIVGEETEDDILKNTKSAEFKIIRVKGLKGKLNFCYDPIVLIKLIKLMRKNHYDIIHTHTTKTGILGKIAARVSGVPLIIHGLHGSSFQAFDNNTLNKALIFFEKWTSRYTDAYVSVSEILSKKYIKEGIGRDDNHFVVYSGMKLKKFYNIRKNIDRENKLKELGIDLDSFIIGNVARLEKRKGHRYLIDAFKKIVNERKDIKLKLLIIGEGEEKESLLNYIKELKLEDNIILTGYRKDIEELMAIMNIFVLTSLREGLPRVLVQATAVGVPSVTFNIDGASEVIKDNYNGFLIKPKEVNQLVDGITKYIKDRELIKLHGMNGREIAVNKWSIEGMVDKIETIYQDLIKRKILC